MSPAKIKMGVVSVVALVLLFAFGNKLVGKNDFGHYQVIQSLSGDITVRNTPGYYSQQFANVTTYKTSDIVYFSKSKVDGGDSELTAPVEVRFSDGSTAQVSGILKYRIPTNTNLQKRIHKDFQGNERGLRNLVRQTALEALMQTASLIKAEDAYSTRRSEFKSIARTQIEKGILSTRSVEKTVTDAQGRVSIERIPELVKGENGKYIVSEKSSFNEYGLEIVQFSIKDIDFDKKVDELIAKKKEAEQAKVVAKAQAEEAKQNAITEREKGKARIAKAKADEEVAKITAVTRAQKEKEVAKLVAQKEKEVFELNAERDFQVAKLNKKAEMENAEALLVKKQAEAKANELLVKAGLTPLEAATIEKQTAIGVARELAKLKLPSTVIAGGAGGAGSGNGGLLFQAMGINQILELNDKLKSTKAKTK